MHNELVDIVVNAKPNPIHYAIVELEKLGKIIAIITQLPLSLKSAEKKISVNYKIECPKCRKKFNLRAKLTKNGNLEINIE